jgi:chromosome transmission fidelity protein 1
MVGRGREIGACPYYASKDAVTSSQLVTLPYNLLLHKEMREAMGISLEGNIVVIDEAHNLIESINSMYSVQLPAIMITASNQQLTSYHEKYSSKLKPSNLEWINTIRNILVSFINFLTKESEEMFKSKRTKPNEEECNKKLFSINDLIFGCGMEDINWFQLEKFFETSEITKKVQGFAEFSTQDEEKEDEELYVPSTASALACVRSFLLSLSNPDQDGRILVSLSSRWFAHIYSH